jgi:hypothetical protein
MLLADPLVQPKAAQPKAGRHGNDGCLRQAAGGRIALSGLAACCGTSGMLLNVLVSHLFPKGSVRYLSDVLTPRMSTAA